MDRNVLLTALVVVAVVLAGCGSTTGPGLTDETDTTIASEGGDGGIAGDGAATTRQATVNFYVSDAPIDDFAHLNVTVTKVGFQYAGDPGSEDEEGSVEVGDDGNETATPDSNTTTGPDTVAPEETTAGPTTTANSDSDGADSDVEDGENEEEEDGEEEGEAEDEEEAEEEGEAEDEEEAEEEGEAEDEEDSDDGEADSPDDENGEDESEGESGEWIERDVQNRTVDLTELTGPNATLIDSPTLPAGKYTKVFVYVSDVQGILEDGSEVNVKLPSERLHLNTPFEVGTNESVDFVFDISAHKAGKSGKYILKPVASASGVDQPIEPVGGPDDLGPEAGAGEGGPPGEADGNESDGDEGDTSEATTPDEQASGNGGPPEDGGDGGPPDEGDGVDEGASEAEKGTTAEG